MLRTVLSIVPSKTMCMITLWCKYVSSVVSHVLTDLSGIWCMNYSSTQGYETSLDYPSLSILHFCIAFQCSQFNFFFFFKYTLVFSPNG